MDSGATMTRAGADPRYVLEHPRATPMNMRIAKRFVGEHHYARHCPPHCLEALGLYQGGILQGVSIWGWGVRPQHTIQQRFPTYTTKDYRELNRLCVLDDMPRNTESAFIASCVKWFKRERPDIKVLLSWADGMRGKPGYVYQASNWLYAGFIETEFYLTTANEVVHPRQLITQYGTRTRAFTDSLGLQKAHGKQFLYLYFLTRESRLDCIVPLSRKYPKQQDCSLWFDNGAVRDAQNVKSAVGHRNGQGILL